MKCRRDAIIWRVMAFGRTQAHRYAETDVANTILSHAADQPISWSWAVTVTRLRGSLGGVTRILLDDVPTLMSH